MGEPGGIDPELLLTAMAMVSQAEVILGELRRREGLREGATVDRAAGVIIAQRGCGVQEAYDVLRDTAQRLGMDRQAVAERLIAAAARNAATRTPARSCRSLGALDDLELQEARSPSATGRLRSPACAARPDPADQAWKSSSVSQRV